MPNEIRPILEELYGIEVQEVHRGLRWDEIVRTIDAGRPMIAWVWNGPMSAHVVVIAGYRANGSLVILDPLRGRYDVPYGMFGTPGMGQLWNLTWVIEPSAQLEEALR
jgi:hypothetical protein